MRGKPPSAEYHAQARASEADGVRHPPGNRQRINRCDTRRSCSGKTGRIVGTVAGIGLAISVLAIIYMAMRPHVQPKDNSSLHLLLPPPAQPSDK
jgi:hypothetical protein